VAQDRVVVPPAARDRVKVAAFESRFDVTTMLYVFAVEDTTRRDETSFSVGSIANRDASLHDAYEPLLSVAHVSIASADVTAEDLASASLPLLRWFRNEGMAIAARMPMIRITTRSSIRVKPFSSWVRSRSFRNMLDSS
jgi:hypothetical protein